MAKNNHGFAVLESVCAGLLFFTFVGTLLLAAYFQFGEAWVQYRSEQALYCMAEGQPEGRCKKELQATIEKFLPWGRWRVHLASRPNKWLVEIKWECQEYTLHFKKDLNVDLLVKRKVSLL